MVAHIEARGVSLPEWTAEVAALFACFQLLHPLVLIYLDIFKFVTEYVLIAATLVTGMARCFIILPFVRATAADNARLAMCAHAWLARIPQNALTMRRVISDGETQVWTFSDWHSVIQDLFQKLVDVELDGDASVVNIVDAGGL